MAPQAPTRGSATAFSTSRLNFYARHSASDRCPFVADPVQKLSRVVQPLAALLIDIDEPINDLSRVEFATTIADCLTTLDGSWARTTETINVAGVAEVRDYLAARSHEHTPAGTLETIAGIDRYSIARHFRQAYGTSPDRYRTQRRLAPRPHRHRRRTHARPRRRGRRVRRPEPHDPPVQTYLRSYSLALGGTRAPAASARCRRLPSLVRTPRSSRSRHAEPSVELLRHQRN